MSENIEYLLNKIALKKEGDINNLKTKLYVVLANVCFQGNRASSLEKFGDLCDEVIKRVAEITKTAGNIILSNLMGDTASKIGELLSSEFVSLQRNGSFYILVQSNDRSICGEDSFYCIVAIDLLKANALKEIEKAEPLRLII